jgi:pimeloyl-ACP methyl ester carboxylesterase
MVPPTDSAESAAREFVSRFTDGAFGDAADLLSADGREAVVESYPEGFTRDEMEAEDALEAYSYGLYGQYGEFERVDDVTEDGEKVTVALAFEDGTQTLELTVQDGDVAAASFPAEYEPPGYADESAFEERDVTVDADDVELGGVLTVPDGDGPFPGVVLVHGAGLHDADGTAGSSKILRDFAWGLASEGIAVLRYEKRLLDHEVADETMTFDTVVVDDAIAAVDELAGAAEVADDSVFVAGHSQGGMAAPRIADRHGGVAGVVSIDGPADPGMDADNLSFLRYSIEPDGDLTEEQEEELEAKRETFRRVAEGDYDPDEEVLGKPGRWHDSVNDVTTGETAAEVDAAVFVAKAGRADPDVQPEIAEMHEEHYEDWCEYDLGQDSTVEFYENVDHYMQEGYDPSGMAALYFPGNAAEYVVTDVADWVHDVANA